MKLGVLLRQGFKSAQHELRRWPRQISQSARQVIVLSILCIGNPDASTLARSALHATVQKHYTHR